MKEIGEIASTMHPAVACVFIIASAAVLCTLIYSIFKWLRGD